MKLSGGCHGRPCLKIRVIGGQWCCFEVLAQFIPSQLQVHAVQAPFQHHAFLVVIWHEYGGSITVASGVFDLPFHEFPQFPGGNLGAKAVLIDMREPLMDCLLAHGMPA